MKLLKVELINDSFSQREERAILVTLSLRSQDFDMKLGENFYSKMKIAWESIFGVRP